MTMESYDPNDAVSLKMRHVVEITLQAWRYSTTIEATIGGNCAGFDNLEHAITMAYEELLGDAEQASVILTDPDGDTLLYADEEDRQEDWLKDMVVATRIIRLEPKP